LGQNFPVAVVDWPHFAQVRGGAGASDAPQFGQNLTPTVVGCPHFGHGGPCAAGAGPPIGLPQLGQNRFPAGTIAPHFGHGIDGPPPAYIPCIWPVIP